jgi:hypothetical protein
MVWYAARQDRTHLPIVFKELGFSAGVEIGTQRGLYAEVLCKGHPGLHLTCVDPWHGGRKSREQFERNYHLAVERLAPYHVTILRKTSLEAVADVPDRSIDFVYIDGNHEFNLVCPDIIFWSQKVKSGGIVACHDYSNWHEVGVMQAVDAYTFCNGIGPKYVTQELEPTAFWVNP